VNIKIGKSINPHNATAGKVTNRRSGDVKAKTSPSLISTIQLKESIQNQLEIVKLNLKNPSLLTKLPLKTVLPPLNEILLLLGFSSLNPNDADLKLMEKFLQSWLDKYGDFLPDKQRKELVVLRNMLVSARMNKAEDESWRLVLNYSGEQSDEFPKWKVTYRGEKEPSQKENDDEKIECALNLSCLNLGEIKVLLSRRKERFYCDFSSSLSLSRQRIRKHLDQFKNYLQNSGIDSPHFSISRKLKEKKLMAKSEKSRVGLWV
jgi:hypothetical protein